jgi:hypothetical protein
MNLNASSAVKQRRVPLQVKQQLINEAGGKCANPGCSRWRTHLHHIKQWAVFKTHDSQHMIAVCPSCHDDVHHSLLSISDDTVYAWKKIVRNPNSDHRDHIYVEPASPTKILLGSLFLTTVHPELVIFKLSNQNTFSMRILEADILLLDVLIKSSDGKDVLRVSDNHVRVCRAPDVDFQRRQGKIRLTVPSSPQYVIPWVPIRMRELDPNYAADGRIVVFDAEVLGPGLVRVQGLWHDADGAYVVTGDTLAAIRPVGSIRLEGGEGSGIDWSEPITTSAFGFLLTGRP